MPVRPAQTELSCCRDINVRLALVSDWNVSRDATRHRLRCLTKPNDLNPLLAPFSALVPVRLSKELRNPLEMAQARRPLTNNGNEAGLLPIGATSQEEANPYSSRALAD